MCTPACSYSHTRKIPIAVRWECRRVRAAELYTCIRGHTLLLSSDLERSLPTQCTLVHYWKSTRQNRLFSRVFPYAKGHQLPHFFGHALLVSSRPNRRRIQCPSSTHSNIDPYCPGKCLVLYTLDDFRVTHGSSQTARKSLAR